MPWGSTGSFTQGGSTSTAANQGNGPFSGFQSGFTGMLGTNPTYNTINPNYYDPLQDAQGQGMRSGIYGMLSGLFPGMMNNAQRSSTALGQAYAAPGWGQGRNLASAEMQGQYLSGSPQLDAAMAQLRAGSNASTANTNAGVRSSYALNGMNFGTGNQEAELANQASNNASANNAEAQARLQNYENERGIQSNAINQYSTATSTPLNYLAQSNESYMTPLTEMSQIISGLSKGGTVAQPDTIVDKGALGDLLGAVGSV